MRKFAGIAAVLLAAAPVAAQEAEEGLRLAIANCSQCHALGESDASPFKDAPPFRTIHDWYREGELEQVFKEGIVASHPAMPQWKMTPGQARALAAFIMSFGPAKED
jgi:mono/diheme cytochrome c family protein